MVWYRTSCLIDNSKNIVTSNFNGSLDISHVIHSLEYS